MPVVSVIMPVYNEEQNIVQAVNSILSQSFKDFELIIVDDCSTDKTVEIIKTYQDSRIKLIIKNQNTGISDTLNVGIAASQGEFIARMDADDISHPNRLMIQIKFFEDNPDIVLAGTWAYLIDKQCDTSMECKPPTAHNDIVRYLQKDNPFIHSSVVFRKTALGQTGKYEKLQGVEDYSLWIRMAVKYKVANIPQFVVTRYENNNLNTRPAYKGLKKFDIYYARLKQQLLAVKNFGINLKTFWYIPKTIISMILCKFHVLK